MKRFFAAAAVGPLVHVVVGVTGASGIRYGSRLLECLRCDSTVIVSSEAEGMLEGEVGMTREELESLAGGAYDNGDLWSPIASGSVRFDALVIVPCSMSTLSKISCGIADNLITRAASVALKERRKLVLVPRETPFSTIHLQNMTRLSEAGAVVLPACPAFYPRPESVDDMVDFVVGRVLDQLGLEHDMYSGWSGAYE
jgi:4-hydroxy-3-polyprenylbenzoate decarboxylase